VKRASSRQLLPDIDPATVEGGSSPAVMSASGGDPGQPLHTDR
jgi:hypothetical protein